MESGSPSLDTTCINAKTESPSWDRKQKRHYQHIMSVLYRWEARNLSIVWVTLTTAVGGEARKLRVHERELRRRVEKTFGSGRIEYVCVDTTEGNGVLHLLWAAEGNLYVPKEWLWEQWEKIHGAKSARILRYRRGSRRGLSKYMVSQYMAGQKGAGVRISGSWKKTFGIAIKRAWRTFKRYGGHLSFRALIDEWEAFLRGETVSLQDVVCGRVARVLFVSLAGWRQVEEYLYA